MYAATETIARESIWLTEPDISKRRMIPVMGARTMAVKNPAMARSTKIVNVHGIQTEYLHPGHGKSAPRQRSKDQQREENSARSAGTEN